MTNWVRLWEDMPTDPKWRVISRRAGRPLSEVLAVFVIMMTNAGANATERGKLSGWDDEDIAAALDMDGAHVAAIREAMQGKTLDGDHLTGWEKRQPKREDGAAERAAAWREQKKREREQCERARTQPNATERPEENRIDTDISPSLRSGDSAPKREAGKTLPDDWTPPEELFAYAQSLGMTRGQAGETIENMRLWAHANRNRAIARKADWISTMKGAIRRDSAKCRAGPVHERRDPVIEAGLSLMEEYRLAETSSEYPDDYAECAPVERLDWRSAG